MSLVKCYSKKLDDAIINSPIACKETIAAVIALTYKEQLLKIRREKPFYLLLDNNVFCNLLARLEETK